MNELPLTDNFLATPERYLWHTTSATAILSDLHLGAEAELTRRGIFMPDVSSAALQSAWSTLCQRLSSAPAQSRLIIAGDLFDTTTPDASAQNQARHLLTQLPPNCTPTLLPGNHDPAPEVLRQIFAGLPLQIEPYTTVGGYHITHGHEIPPTLKTAAGLIVGHQHPAVVLQDRVQSARMICFALCRIPTLKGPLILLPAFSRAPLGSNLLTDRHWILDLSRPNDASVQILGLLEPRPPNPAQLLNFGSLALLRNLNT